MTKADIVEKIFEKIKNVNKKQITDWVELVFKTIKDTLAQGEDIKISGFGNFKLRVKKPRVGRNPRTGQTVEITARRVLTFRPSDILREAVNSGDMTKNSFDIDEEVSFDDVAIRGDINESNVARSTGGGSLEE